MEVTFTPYVQAFGWIGLCLLMGTILRYKVKFFQTLLLPSSIIGGLIGFFLINFGLVGAPSSTGWITIQPASFGVITFHLFVISLLGISLLRPEGNDKSQKKTFWKGAWWIACMFLLCFSLQCLLGMGVFYIAANMFGMDVNPVLGYLFGVGFTQGPGQAVAYGGIYETGGISNAINIALAFAACGFFMCSFIGVPLAKYGIKKGWCANKDNEGLSPEFLCGVMDIDNQKSSIANITHPCNVESLGYHMAIFFVIYFLAYCVAVMWQTYMPQSVKLLGFGMLFLWAMLIAIIFQNSMAKLKMGHWLDNSTIRRFTGLFIDFMVTAVFMSIEVRAIQHLFLPIIVTIALGSLMTFGLAIWFGRRLPELGFERTLYIVGTCTGTSATGLLLVRMVDPEFKTSVAAEGAMFNVPVLFIGAPMTVIIPLAYRPDLYWISVLVFLGTAIAMPILLFISRQVSKPKL